MNTNGVFDQIHRKWFLAYERESLLDQARYFIFGAWSCWFLPLMAVAWVWTLRRIVKRRTSELKSSEERYRLLFTKSPVGLFYYDTSLRITNSNEIVNRIMGTNREALEGFDLNQMPDTRILPAIKAVLDHEEGYYEGHFNPIGELVKTTLYITLHTTPIFNEKHELQRWNCPD